MESSIKSNGIVIFQIICIFIISIFNMLDMPKFVSLAFSASFLTVFYLFINETLKRRINKGILILIVLIFFNVIMDFVNNGAGIITFSYLRKALIFISTILSFYYAKKITISEKEYKIIRLVLFFISIVPIISYYILDNKITYGGYITLNYSNPNIAGMWILISITTLIYLFFTNKNLSIKLLYSFLVYIETSLLLVNNTRSCIVSLVIYFVLIVYYLIRKKYNIKTFPLILITYLPIIFLIIYLFVINNNFFLQKFSFLVNEGKTLTSRVLIWNYSLSFFYKNPILGNYYAISDGTGMSQLHNISLDILVSYGVFVFILYNHIFIKGYDWLKNEKNNLPSLIAILTFLTFYITGCFEAAIVSGSMGLSIFLSIYIILSKYESEGAKND